MDFKDCDARRPNEASAGLTEVVSSTKKPPQVGWPFDCRVAGDDVADLQLLNVAEHPLRTTQPRPSGPGCTDNGTQAPGHRHNSLATQLGDDRCNLLQLDPLRSVAGMYPRSGRRTIGRHRPGCAGQRMAWRLGGQCTDPGRLGYRSGSRWPRQIRRIYDAQVNSAQLSHCGPEWKPFTKSLLVIRKRGCCISESELRLQRAGVAAPIFDEKQRVLGSMTLWSSALGILARFSRTTCVTLITAAASELTARGLAARSHPTRGTGPSVSFVDSPVR